jgi:protein involved in polysaccharide export with SLBB domain
MKILSVSLNRALAGDPSADILLESRDRLLVHRSPGAVEPSVVYVEGEVGTPGRYPLTANMTVADLIRVGGGLKPSADPNSADLTRYSWTTGGEVTASHESLSISDALASNAGTDQPLHNGDVLTIRERPGWEALGSSITVRGAVRHPGTYGIRPGERLSDVIERAGGFLPGAYPYGAILQRSEVRRLEEQQRMEMLAQLKGLEGDLNAIPASDQKQQETKAMATAQFQSTVVALSATPPLGRVEIRITSDVRHWKNTGADITVRGGDTLTIPRRPDYVMVSGNVFNPTAVSYRPGRSAKWYLSQSGGPTALGDKKGIFVVRADGSVIGEKKTLWIGDSLSAVLEPGDTIVVPQRAAPMGGGVQWPLIFSAGQMAAGIATAVTIALHY